jgi:GNAT superfamily N-acetyltransferase
MPDAMKPPGVRLATPDDAERLAQLLHEFNVEFGTDTPGPDVLAPRLRRLLGTDRTFCVVAGDPISGFGLVTLRPNVWFDSPVALLDELYVVPHLRGHGIGSSLLAGVESVCRARGVEQVEINVDEPDHDARRFYERHGYRCGDPDGGTALYYERLLTDRTAIDCVASAPSRLRADRAGADTRPATVARPGKR